MDENNENIRTEYYDEYEIDLREYIMLLWDNKWFIAGLVAAALIAVLLVSVFLLQPVYETNAGIQLSNMDGLYSEPDSAVQILKSSELWGNVMENLGEDFSPAELRSYIKDNVKINPVNNTRIINITVLHSEPKTAKAAAEGIIDNFKKRSEEYFSQRISNKEEFIANLKTRITELQSDIDNNKSMIKENAQKGNTEVVSSIVEENTSLNSTYKELRILLQSEENELLNYYPMVVLNAPYLPENPVSPNIKLNLAIAGVLALMLGVFIVFFKEFMKEE